MLAWSWIQDFSDPKSWTRILAIQYLQLRILAIQNLELWIFAIRNLEFRSSGIPKFWIQAFGKQKSWIQNGSAIQNFKFRILAFENFKSFYIYCIPQNYAIFSSRVACHSTKSLGVANGTSKNVGLWKFWQDIEVSEEFFISLEVSFAWFVFTFFESRKFLPKSLGLGFPTRISVSRRVSDFTIRHPSHSFF